MADDEHGMGTDVVHFPPPVFCLSPINSVEIRAIAPTLLGRLARLVFPYRIGKYPGRSKAFAEAMGYAPSTMRLLVKPRGSDLLTLPVISAAEKIIARYQSELTAISAGLALKRRELESREKPRPGFFAMRVKRTRQNDQSGQKF